jgi:hypothetical protein
MLNELLDRIPDMEVCGEVARLHSTLVAGIKSMPVRWKSPKYQKVATTLKVLPEQGRNRRRGLRSRSSQAVEDSLVTRLL